MVLPSARPLSFSQIRNEFGQNSTDSLGGYRIKQTVGQMVDMPLSEGIGQEDDDQTFNSIRFSQFRGNRLNVVLQYNTNYGTFSDQDPAPGAQEKYQDAILGTGVNDEVVVVGNFKDKPANGDGKRIIIHVTSTIGGGKKNIEQTKCSLITGNGWANDTEFYINVGPQAKIFGTGGFGGQGGSSEGSNGGAGEDGSSAIGINYVSTTTNLTNKIIVQEGGEVCAGGGGGGGGGGAKSDTNRAPGGRGGAGAGIPDHESGPNNSNRKKGLDGATGDKKGDAAGGGGGGGGAMPSGEPGAGGEAPTKPGPPSNPNNSQAVDGDPGTTSGGGAGGKGDAEGPDSQDFAGDGGAGGENGFAIARVVGTNIPTIIDPGNGIKGDISEPIFGSLQKAELLII